MKWMFKSSVTDYKHIPYYEHTYALQSSDGHEYALSKLLDNIPPTRYEGCPDEYAAASPILSRLREINKDLKKTLEENTYDMSLEELKYICNHREYIKRIFDTETLLADSVYTWYEEEEKKKPLPDDIMMYHSTCCKVSRYISALSKEVDAFESLFFKCIEV